MLKRIALHIEKDKACETRTWVATTLAKSFQAELIGVYVAPLPFQYAYENALIPNAVHEVVRRQLDEERARCREEFEHRAARAGVAAQWRAPHGPPEETLALHVRCTDLLITSQTDDQNTDSVIAPYLLESIIMTAGRPVLVIPYAGLDYTVGKRILFCWDHGREAARALSDAAPFLAKAEEIFALTLDTKSEEMRRRETVADDLHAYFDAQGYAKPQTVIRDTADVGIGNAILNAASDYGCDMIVMGLYGHSRAREWVLGGASREILNSMTMPVLFSH